LNKTVLSILCLALFSAVHVSAEEITIPYIFGNLDKPNACAYYPKPKFRAIGDRFMLNFKGKDFIYDPNIEEYVGIRQVEASDITGDGQLE